MNPDDLMEVLFIAAFLHAVQVLKEAHDNGDREAFRRELKAFGNIFKGDTE